MYNRKIVFSAACIGLLLFGMTLITLGSILPSLKESFPGDVISEGTLVSLLPIGLMLGSLVFGPVVDRYGYKLVLIFSVLISIIALEGLAYTKSPAILYTCIFFIGVGGGIINGSTSALVSDISTDNKGANLSLLGVFFGIGALGMPLLLGFLSAYFSYSSILSIVGLFMLLPVVYFSMVRFPAPKQEQGFPLMEGIGLVKQTSLLLLGFFLFFQSGIEALINNWTTSFLEVQRGMSSRNALYALSASVVGLTLARLLLGSLMKRISSYTVMLVSLTLVVIGCLGLYLSMNHTIAFISLVITGMGLAAGFPVILGYIGQLFSSLSGTAFSIALVIALTGNTLLNFGFGQVVERQSTKHLPLLVIACVLFMFIILFFIKKNITGKVKL